VSTARARCVATVRGLVQGVGFRWYVQDRAAGLGLAGWVSNQADGSVEVVAEGAQAALDQFELELWEGPPGSLVSAVEVHHEPARGNLLGFVIRSGAHPGD
jgi:acylphosphatase